MLRRLQLCRLLLRQLRLLQQLLHPHQLRRCHRTIFRTRAQPRPSQC
jgi:hypothetical protein